MISSGNKKEPGDGIGSIGGGNGADINHSSFVRRLVRLIVFARKKKRRLSIPIVYRRERHEHHVIGWLVSSQRAGLDQFQDRALAHAPAIGNLLRLKEWLERREPVDDLYNLVALFMAYGLLNLFLGFPYEIHALLPSA